MFAASGQAAVMRSQDEGGLVEPVEFEEKIYDLSGTLEVEISGGLIREQDPGAACKGPGEGDPLLLATRQPGRLVGEPLPQAHRGERRPGPLVGIRKATDPEGKGDIVERGQGWQEME